MQGKTFLIDPVLPLFIVLIWSPNTFMGKEHLTKMATEAVNPQMIATKFDSYHSDSILFETTCKHENLNISSTCDYGNLGDNGKCSLFELKSSTSRSKEITPTKTYQYSHFPCRTWKIMDMKEKKIKLHFNGFHTQTCCSNLAIFDGPNSTYNKLFSITNQKNHHKPVDIESSGNTLFLHFISNISFIHTEQHDFHISYSINNEDEDFYQYDYINQEVDYVVLDLPEYYDDDDDSIDYNHVPSEKPHLINPFLNLVVKPKQLPNLGEQKTNENMNQDNTTLKREGELCGSCHCPPTYTAGECWPGLKCIHSPDIADAPGICRSDSTLENDVYLEHLESISSTNNDIVGSAKTRSSIAGGGESGVGMFFFVIGLIILLAGIGAIFYFR